MGDWLSTSVLLHCELQSLAEDVVASIATGFSFTMANGKTVLLASQAPTTECYGLNLERSDTSGVTLGSCSEHKGEKVVPLLTAQVLARVRRVSIGESRSCCQASSLKSLEGGSCESGVGTYLRVRILRDTWKMKVSVWTGCFVFMIFYFGFCSAFFNKELLHFAINTGEWQIGCLADVEGGAFCCVTFLKTLSACPGAKRLLQVVGMVLVLD